MTEHTPTPWVLCHHLQSPEKDASCKCGYRGGIWGGSGEVLVCEMGTCNCYEGHDMIDVGNRSTQLANAAFIVKAVNNHAALVKALIEIIDAYDYCTLDPADRGYSVLSDAIGPARSLVSSPSGSGK
jgi:hypothetical protein